MPSRSPAKMSKLTLDFPRHLQEVAIEEAMRIQGGSGERQLAVDLVVDRASWFIARLLFSSSVCRRVSKDYIAPRIELVSNKHHGDPHARYSKRYAHVWQDGNAHHDRCHKRQRDVVAELPEVQVADDNRSPSANQHEYAAWGELHLAIACLPASLCVVDSTTNRQLGMEIQPRT